MGALKPLALLVLTLTVAAGPSPAGGQCRLCDKPTTALSQSADGEPIELEIETSLDFDRVVLAGSGRGAAVIRPDGSNAAEGALSRVGPSAMVGTAIVHGIPERAVRVELPRRIDLYSTGGGRIAVDEVVSDLPSLPRLDSTGKLTFRFGGRVQISGDADGDYRGELPITVEYQ
jgi:hypothetical protein